jgi:hypothetical protein
MRNKSQKNKGEKENDWIKELEPPSSIEITWKQERAYLAAPPLR